MRYLINQIYNFSAPWHTDEVIRFWGEKVKGQGQGHKIKYGEQCTFPAKASIPVDGLSLNTIYAVSQKSSLFLFLWLLGQMLTDFICIK